MSYRAYILADKNPCIPAHLAVGPIEPPFGLMERVMHILKQDNACVNFEELSLTGRFFTNTDAPSKMEIDIETLETVGRLPDP